MSTDQEYWDACLIRSWRRADKLFDAVILFESLTKKRITDMSLLRTPPLGMPWKKIGVRVFVADFLPKIGDWLWNHQPESDVALLKKLTNSKYTTSKTISSPKDTELENLYKERRKMRERLKLVSTNISERNSATDWGVTKGHARVRRKR